MSVVIGLNHAVIQAVPIRRRAGLIDQRRAVTDKYGTLTPLQRLPHRAQPQIRLSCARGSHQHLTAIARPESVAQRLMCPRLKRARLRE